jgi:hypothetical protein
LSTVNEESQHVVTQWGDYEIAVKTDSSTSGHLAGSINGQYEIYKLGQLLARERVPATFYTADTAAACALRIAKLDAMESFGNLLSSY